MINRNWWVENRDCREFHKMRPHYLNIKCGFLDGHVRNKVNLIFQPSESKRECYSRLTESTLFIFIFKNMFKKKSKNIFILRTATALRPAKLKSLIQYETERCFTSVCLFKDSAWRKTSEQYEHLNGFSPVCILRCRLIRWESYAAYAQIKQTYLYILSGRSTDSQSLACTRRTLESEGKVSWQYWQEIESEM